MAGAADAIATLKAVVQVDFASGRSELKSFESAFTSSANAIRGNITQIETSAKGMGSSASGAGQAAASGFATMSKAAQEAEKSTSGLGKTLSDIGKQAAGFAAGMAGLQGITAIMGGLKSATIGAAGEMQAAAGRFQAQLGISAEAARDLGNVTKTVFRDNFGGSLTEAAAAVSVVTQQFRDLEDRGKGTIASITEDAFRLKDAFGVDAKESVSAVNTLMSQFGISSQKAFDLVTFGLQSGLNRSGDFLDTINEYSTQFRAGGASAEQFFSLIQTGAAGGVLGTDKAADAFKEFRVRIQDGSTATSDGLKQLGIDSGKLGKDMASGQVTAAQAFDLVMGKLRGIDDKNVAMQAGVALLGTQFEDLGTESALALSLTTKGFDDVAGATKGLDVQYNSLGAVFEGLKRKAIVDFLMPMGDVLLRVINGVLPSVTHGFEAVSTVVSGLAEPFASIGGKLADLMGINLTGMTTTWGAWKAVIQEVRTVINGFVNVVHATFEGNLGPVMTRFGLLLSNVIGSGASQVITGTLGLIIGGVQSLVAAFSGAQNPIGAFRDAVTAVFGPTAGAAVQGFANTIATIASVVGGALLSAWSAVQPVVQSVFGFLRDSLGPIVTSIGGVLAAVGGWSLAMTALGAVAGPVIAVIAGVLGTVLSPIGLIIAGVAALAVAWRNDWGNIQEITRGTIGAIAAAWPTIQSAAQTAISFITDHWQTLLLLLGGSGVVILGIITFWDQIKAAAGVAIDFIRDHWGDVKTALLNGWNDIVPAATAVWSAIREGASGIIAWVQVNWPSISEAIMRVITPLAVTVGAVLAGIYLLWHDHGEQIKQVISITFDTIKGVIQGALTIVGGIIKTVTAVINGDWGTAWDGIKDIVRGAWTIVQSTVEGGVKIIVTVLEGFRDVLGRIGGAAVNLFTAPFKAIPGLLAGPINFAIGVINGFIGGINAVLGKLPGGLSIPTIGTVGGGGGSGGNSTSNDRSSGAFDVAFAEGGMTGRAGIVSKPTYLVGEGRAPEYVIPTDPAHRGRAMNLWADAGKKLGVPGFDIGGVIGGAADAVGGAVGGAADIVKNLVSKGASALVGELLGGLPQMGNDVVGEIERGGIAKLKDAALGLIGGAIDKVKEAAASVTGTAANLPGSVTDWLNEAISLTGASSSWLGPLLNLVAAESSGNPNAYNPEAVSTGEHAQGLLQTIPSTFGAYALPGHTNILNPVDNAAAAIRYIQQRYGSVPNPNAPGYVGYANGGVINEPIAGMGLHSGTNYLFGERGPERITPLAAGGITQASPGGSSVSGDPLAILGSFSTGDADASIRALTGDVTALGVALTTTGTAATTFFAGMNTAFDGVQQTAEPVLALFAGMDTAFDTTAASVGALGEAADPIAGLFAGMDTAFDGVQQSANAVSTAISTTGDAWRLAQVAMDPMRDQLRNLQHEYADVHRALLTSKMELLNTDPYSARAEAIKSDIQILGAWETKVKDQIDIIKSWATEAKQSSSALDGFVGSLVAAQSAQDSTKQYGAGGAGVTAALEEAFSTDDPAAGGKLFDALDQVLQGVKGKIPDWEATGTQLIAAFRTAIEQHTPETIQTALTMLQSINDKVKEQTALTAITFNTGMAQAFSAQSLTDTLGSGLAGIYGTLKTALETGGPGAVDAAVKFNIGVEGELAKLPASLQNTLGPAYRDALLDMLNNPTAATAAAMEQQAERIHHAFSIIPAGLAEMAAPVQAAARELSQAADSGTVSWEEAGKRLSAVAKAVPADIADMPSVVQQTMESLRIGLENGTVSISDYQKKSAALIATAKTDWADLPVSTQAALGLLDTQLANNTITLSDYQKRSAGILSQNAKDYDLFSDSVKGVFDRVTQAESTGAISVRDSGRLISEATKIMDQDFGRLDGAVDDHITSIVNLVLTGQLTLKEGLQRMAADATQATKTLNEQAAAAKQVTDEIEEYRRKYAAAASASGAGGSGGGSGQRNGKVGEFLGYYEGQAVYGDGTGNTMAPYITQNPGYRAPTVTAGSGGTGPGGSNIDPSTGKPIPSFGGGGTMPWDGLAFVHQGEQVLTPVQQRQATGGSSTPIDYDRLGQAVAVALQAAGIDQPIINLNARKVSEEVARQFGQDASLAQQAGIRGNY